MLADTPDLAQCRTCDCWASSATAASFVVGYFAGLGSALFAAAAFDRSIPTSALSAAHRAVAGAVKSSAICHNISSASRFDAGLALPISRGYGLGWGGLLGLPGHQITCF